MSSTRLPEKMLLPIGGVPLVEYVYRRCTTSTQTDIVAVITSLDSTDDPLADYCGQKNIPVFRGSLNNVLDRYIKAADHFNLDNIVRVCGDSPFVAVDKLDELLNSGSLTANEYVTIDDVLNGFVFEVVKKNTLSTILQKISNPEDLEHVTYYIRRHINNYQHKIVRLALRPLELESITLTVDTKEDLNLANRVVANGLSGYKFSSFNVINILTNMELTHV